MSDTPVLESPAKAPPAIDTIVERYVQLRDRKAAFKKEYEAKVEAIDTALDRLEAFLLKHFSDRGIESVKTAAGTAYISVKTSASVADKEGFLAYVRERDEWSMLDVRANKTVIAEFKEAHGDLPPGINWSAMRTVGIRRS